MNKGIFIFLIFLFIQGAFLIADEDNTQSRNHFLIINYNVLFHSSRDEIMSPLTYSSVNMGGTLSYKYISNKNYHLFSLSFIIGRPKTSVEFDYARPTSEGNIEEYESNPLFIQAELYYGYLRAVIKNNNVFFLYIGGLFDFYLNLHMSSEIGWLSAFSLNFSILAEIRIKSRHKITLQLFTPFVTYLGRPSWSVYNDEIIDASNKSYLRIIFLGKLTSFNGFRRITTFLNYEITLTKRILLNFIYEFTFFNAPEPRPIKTLINNLSCGIIFKFSRRNKE